MASLSLKSAHLSEAILAHHGSLALHRDEPLGWPSTAPGAASVAAVARAAGWRPVDVAGWGQHFASEPGRDDALPVVGRLGHSLPMECGPRRQEQPASLGWEPKVRASWPQAGHPREGLSAGRLQDLRDARLWN